MRTGHNGKSGDEREAATTSAAKKQPLAERPGLTSVGGILALQATAGNAAVVQLLRKAGRPPAHSAGAATEGAVVQRMESPPRGRRDSGEYEADASASESSDSADGRDNDSSPERREFLDRIEQEMAAGPDLGELAERAERLGAGAPPFRRIRAIRNSDDEDQAQAAPHSESESESDSPETATASQAVEPLPELPENRLLTPLRDLLMRELRDGGVNRKLKVTFKVDGGHRDPRVASGHAWIEITGSRGDEVSFGFYPEDRYETFNNVQGGIHCPDGYSTAGRATHHESKNVPLKDIVNGYQVAHDRSGASYNLTLHNCSTFAGDAWKAMTGKAIPREWFTAYGLLGTVVSTPHGAAEGIEGHQERRRQRRHERARPLAEGPMRGLIPVPGDADEVADRLAQAKLSQSSSSQSSEEVD